MGYINHISKKANNTLDLVFLGETYTYTRYTDSNISKLEAVPRRRAARWVKHYYVQTSSVTAMMQSLRTLA